MDRNVNVISGLICVGKSRLLEQLRRHPEFQKAFTLSLDDIGIRHWGKRIMTKTEKVYRNELARNEIKTALIVNDVRTVLLEMVMLTRKNHQNPFMEMILDTERYLRLTEPERAGLEGKSLPEGPPRVNLNVILLYCDFTTVKRRIEQRRKEAEKTNSPILNMEGVLDAAIQFEMPEAYTPLPINTSDESAATEKKRMREIIRFFLEQRLPADRVVRKRLEESAQYLAELQEIARKLGMRSGASFLRQDYNPIR